MFHNDLKAYFKKYVDWDEENLKTLFWNMAKLAEMEMQKSGRVYYKTWL